MNIPFNTLIGKVMDSVTSDNYEVNFVENNGDKYRMYHYQACCEDVRVEDICGDLSDLIGVPILEANEFTQVGLPPSVDPNKYYGESMTWTFYNLRTIKGSVTIRFYGSSNGYYSEEVSFEKIDGK